MVLSSLDEHNDVGECPQSVLRVCVCVRESRSVCVCVCVRESRSVCVCVCVCVGRGGGGGRVCIYVFKERCSLH